MSSSGAGRASDLAGVALRPGGRKMGNPMALGGERASGLDNRPHIS
jgi:hypothetical protein